MGETVISRDSIPWRELPHLRIAEAAELAGISLRNLEAAAEDELEFFTIGRIRFVRTDHFRRWIGDLEAEELEPVEAISAEVRRGARAFLESVG